MARKRIIWSLILFIFYPVLIYSAEIGNPGKILLKDNWYVQRSAFIQKSGEELSTKGANTAGWYKARVPSTVMGVLSRNGLYKDIFTDDHYKDTDRKQFDDSWWYCRSFDLPVSDGKHVTLHFDGINYAANIWFNGKLIASRDSIYGPYRQYVFDITRLAKKKGNKLAIELFKAVAGDFNLGFVDWNPRPADENMGLWREVYIETNGEVDLRNTCVQSEVNTSTLKEANLTILTKVVNQGSRQIEGTLRGKIGSIEFSYPVKLAPLQTLDIKLTPEEIPALHIENPRLWWCNNLGSPELYKLDLRFESGGKVSDAELITFGIREIECYTEKNGYKGFRLNGKNVLIKGAGWTDDIFLRDSIQSLEIQVQYAKHLNLNTLRFESIWGNSQDIYDLCDRYGILAMVGWSCQWEWEEYIGKACDDFGAIQTEEEMNLALNSFHDQVIWLRNHPSVFVWLIGSDKCPRPELEERYVKLIKEIDNRPYLASAGTRVSQVSGPTGVKMNGPYEFVSPNYWYIDSVNGGAFGFNTETGPGPQVPILESLKRMIPADKLWPVGSSWDYHCTHSLHAFNTMDVFNKAIEGRYGKPSNLGDYLYKSDAQCYEAMKAMFEAFRANIPGTTGIVLWMLNSAWPSLYWQLYDYYLRPTSAYYAVKKANQPQQLIYNYKTNSVFFVNEPGETVGIYKATAKLLDINSSLISEKNITFVSEPNSSFEILKLDSIKGIVFLSLQLENADGKKIADNFYWLSEKPDVPDWEKTFWAYTPMKSYTDFTGMNSMPECDVNVRYELSENDNMKVLTLHLSNPGKYLAFMVSAQLLDDQGETIYPLFWEDNYVSLLPGETRDIVCTYSKHLTRNFSPKVSIDGWNCRKQMIDIR